MIHITAKHFCAGPVLNDKGYVVRAAPILYYMKGWHADKVVKWCHARRWEVVQTP